MYDTMDEIKTKTKAENPLTVFDTAIKNSSPDLEVRSRRIGGANYQVPREVNPKRKLALAMRWLLEGARTKRSQYGEKASRRAYRRFQKRRFRRQEKRKHSPYGRSQ